RIWRAYLLTELSDNFGPVPDVETAFMGEVPTYQNEVDAYKYCIKELTDAVAKINDVKMSSDEAKIDKFFGGDMSKWKKYANSMRMRLSMRLLNVDPTYAQAQFEAAVKDPAGYISTNAEIARYQEGGGWDNSTGVMTRSWNYMGLSFTPYNLFVGLGGISPEELETIPSTAFYGLADDVKTEYKKYLKDPQTYLGLYLPDQLSDKSNVMNINYLFNYIPSNVDPRAYIYFNQPGTDSPTSYYTFAASKNDGESDAAFELRKRGIDSACVLTNKNPKTGQVGTAVKGTPDTIRIRGKFNFVPYFNGSQGDKSALFRFNNSTRYFATLSNNYRNNENYRVFFGSWESYFLLAEAAVYGWNVGIDAKTAYEKGIDENFAYLGLASLAGDYKASESYNRVGTSVSFTHTTEPVDYQIDYETFDGATFGETKYKDKPTLFSYKAGAVKQVTYKYPKGVLPTCNDALTKILTQKFIAQSPYLPLEIWSDYRRLNLPFFENPVSELQISNMPWYTPAKSGVFSAENVPARAFYPSTFSTNSPESYNAAVDLLSKPGKDGDKVNTPLRWAK
ncbi:MAG: SusD/RagB family nutrient-binding outer membrane lipoprotein, partial [Rikenellaceae bacterium]|nr:SusD/RagB family nutrient-binding outer membrane lipoprotein [Rikenellaceae bacterium]